MMRFPLGGSFSAFAALIATVYAFTAQATTLVYEGFSSSDYTAGSSINGMKSGNKSIGLDTVNGWNSGTGVFTAQSNGLPLPDIWNDGSRDNNSSGQRSENLPWSA